MDTEYAYPIICCFFRNESRTNSSFGFQRVTIRLARKRRDAPPIWESAVKATQQIPSKDTKWCKNEKRDRGVFIDSVACHRVRRNWSVRKRLYVDRCTGTLIILTRLLIKISVVFFYRGLLLYFRRAAAKRTQRQRRIRAKRDTVTERKVVFSFYNLIDEHATGGASQPMGSYHEPPADDNVRVDNTRDLAGWLSSLSLLYLTTAGNEF